MAWMNGIEKSKMSLLLFFFHDLQGRREQKPFFHFHEGLLFLEGVVAPAS